MGLPDAAVGVAGNWSRQLQAEKQGKSGQKLKQKQALLYGPKINHPSTFQDDPPFAAFKHLNGLWQESHGPEGSAESASGSDEGACW